MAFKKEDSMDALTKQVQQLGINGSKKESTVAVTAEEPVLDSARAALVEAISQRQKLMGKVTEASKRNSTRAFPDEAICKHAQAVTKLMQEQDQALDKGKLPEQDLNVEKQLNQIQFVGGVCNGPSC
ncbi:TPA: hypothetical protein ACH3X2_002108 [Trebouxia sp. C0005]